MPFCSECGEKVQNDAKFCESCGTPTEVEAYELPIVHFVRNVPASNVEPSEPAATPLINWGELKNEFPFLKNRRYVVLVVVLLIAAVMNPSEEAHQHVVAAFVSKEMKKNSVSEFADGFMGGGFASAIAAGIVKFTVTSQSYVFFSLTKVIDSDMIIGIGAFGCVYLFPNLTFGED